MCSDEINKGNDIIEKLQNDLSNSKQKLKLKNVVTVQQEQTITQNQDTIDRLNKTNNDRILNEIMIIYLNFYYIS